MLYQPGALTESLTALGASEGLLTAVRPLMLHGSGKLCKALAAVLALEGLFTGV